MRISLKKAYSSRNEIIQRLPIFFNDYNINDGMINIYYHRRKIATIDLERMILDADTRSINEIGTLKENLSICRNLDMFACI